MIYIKTEILVSTMRSDTELHNRMNIKTDAVIVNQFDHNKEETIKYDNYSIRYITSDTIGLSKSRNIALKKSQGDICVFADDDVIYVDGYERIIEDSYRQYPDADIIAFRVDSSTEGYSVNRLKEGIVNKIYSMKIASVQITFKRNSIISNKLNLNEDFGAGSNKYLNGEENIMLYQALTKGLIIRYVDKKIADVSFEESSWRGKGADLEIITKGAMFYEMSKYMYPIYNLQFIFRKRMEFRSELDLRQMYKLIFKGSKERKNKNKKP